MTGSLRTTRGRWRRAALLPALAVAVMAPLLAGPASAAPPTTKPAPGAGKAKPVTTTYDNALAPVIPGGGTVDSCADPMVLKGQDGEMIDGKQVWYMYCTTDPLNDTDLDANGDPVFHRIPMNVSTDLVNWTYVGDAFKQGTAGLPSYAEADAALWAPEVVYSSTFDQYYMFVGVTDTIAAVSGEENCGSDGAIGVATAESPTGPWTFSDEPVVAPRRGGGGCNFLWTYDPDAIGTDTGNLDTLTNTGVLYYGSYYGGVYGSALELTADGARITGTPTMVAIDNKYEGPEVVYRDGYYYMFLSATNCCNGALTGYSVFVGRSTSPLGPFVDQQGNLLTDAQAGGTPFLTMNGNRWVGTGHNTVFEDEAGQWWTIYHAVDQQDPFYAFAPGSENEAGETQLGFTKRPALLDPIDWINGWPTVNGGAGPSDTKMPAPAAQPGQRTKHRTTLVASQQPGRLLAAYSDEFDGSMLSGDWTWDSGSKATTSVPAHQVAGGLLTVDIQRADTFVDVDNAHVLVRSAPDGDYVVETKVRISVPDEGCCFNFAQGGIGVYGDEDRLVKLTHTSIWNTRQTEWAKEISDEQAPVGWSRYGNTIVGAPSEEWTYLRIVVEELNGKERKAAGGDTHSYTAYTSQDGSTYVRGGTWTHTMGDAQQIALFAMGQQPDIKGSFTADFDYVRVYTLEQGRRG
jgi:arabinan endo-1,5-alpha-L-arabinosidase